MKKVKAIQSNSSLDIIVPVKNEEKNIEELTKQINSALSAKNIKYSLTYIVDVSTDKTLEILQKLSNKYPLRFYEKKGKTGKAYSILEGIEYSQCEFVAFIDGDLQYSPKHIPDMLEKLIQNP